MSIFRKLHNKAIRYEKIDELYRIVILLDAYGLKILYRGGLYEYFCEHIDDPVYLKLIHFSYHTLNQEEYLLINWCGTLCQIKSSSIKEDCWANNIYPFNDIIDIAEDMTYERHSILLEEWLCKIPLYLKLL